MKINETLAVTALIEFVEAIEATGGIEKDSNDLTTGCVEGEGDWLDLALAYEMACEALGREPSVVYI